MPLSREARAQYRLSACGVPGGPDVDALQMVWPDDGGAWPWGAAMTDAFRGEPPVRAESVFPPLTGLAPGRPS